MQKQIFRIALIVIVGAFALGACGRSKRHAHSHSGDCRSDPNRGRSDGHCPIDTTSSNHYPYTGFYQHAQCDCYTHPCAADPNQAGADRCKLCKLSI